MSRKFYILPVSLAILFATVLYAGITGTISGYVIDKETGKALPGAQILVEETTMGAMADKNGFYMIHNLPAGTYDVRVRMIGYSKVLVKDVQISVDLITPLDFEILPEILTLNEVVITNKHELIQSEITSSTYFISGSELNDQLPVDSFRDAIALLPGVVGGHFRGGRQSDVSYMLDGLPIQSGFSREISSYFPNSSVVEMMVQTGGFNAEYGHATSGIVNVITRDGRNKVEGNLKIFSDFANTGLTGNDNSRRVEFNVGGPLLIGLGGPLINANYFVAADLNLSDTPHRKEMRGAFDSPIFTNYNLNSKVSFDINKNTIFAVQGLLSNWEWRRFEQQWEQNISGLAEHKHYSHRISASLTHTFDPKFFLSARIANYSTKKQVFGLPENEPVELVFLDPADATSPIIDGAQPWNEKTVERVNLAKIDLVRQVSASHLVKAGFDIQKYNLDSHAFNLIPIPSKKPQSLIAFNETVNDFEYSPTFWGLYLQDKVEHNNITANLGLRYDVFSPKVGIDKLPLDFENLRRKLQAPAPATTSPDYTYISPRLGVSIPLSENERLHVNYGWYYQMPPLYYLYTNAGHNLNGYVPFVGNLDLEPIKTVSSEFSYKRKASGGFLFVFTGFIKEFKNLVDTQTFILNEELIDSNASSIGFTTYTNSANGRASGVELTLQKQFSNQFSGRVSYTWMKARGTSTRAEDEFNRVIFGGPFAEDGKKFPLSWDQRHSFIFDADFESSKIRISALYRLFSPVPVTTPESVFPNDTRLSWRNIFDVKVKIKTAHIMNGRLNPFFEIRNLFNDNNIIDQHSDTGTQSYNLFNPIQTNVGRRLRVGFTMDFQ